ncbi:S1 family peptidase [Paenibacillus sp. 1781tsa1]|uniref:S1 family peptidase n=1 Tax=Paenibacillus sp. 1781tsa1 TaxID=2953810 RepID=UPI00209CB47A|nr:S1 family peptidase [Paenibacillus sp. 1781tsa1]MCP1186484.1 S1 family peptidase [Paenibacillus sp. 1781tsa1]
MGLKRIIALLFSVSLTLSISGVMYAENVEKDSQALINQKYNLEEKFRDEFGFKNNNYQLLSIENESSVQKYGVHLTAQEEAEMDRRVEVEQKFIPDFEKAIRDSSLSKNYAGMYIQQAPEHKIIVRFTGEPTKSFINNNQEGESFVENLNLIVSRQTLDAAYLLSPNEIVYEIVEYSEEQLMGFADNIVSKLNLLKEKNVNVTKIHSDFPNQKVVVSLGNDLSTENQEIIQSMFSTYPLDFNGDLGLIEETARNTYTGTIMGGHEINSTGKCTAGVPAKSRSNGNLFLITAGHCADQGTNFRQGGYLLGPMSNVFMGSYVDSGAIRLSGGNHTPSNVIYNTSGINPGNPTRLTGVQAISSSKIGETVIKSGATTDTTTGTLQGKDVYFTSSTGPGRYLFETSTISQPGDSGSPVFAGSGFKGIVHGRILSNDSMLYSHAERILNGLNMDLYVP